MASVGQLVKLGFGAAGGLACGMHFSQTYDLPELGKMISRASAMILGGGGSSIRKKKKDDD